MTCPGSTPSSPSTPTWPPATVPALGASTYVPTTTTHDTKHHQVTDTGTQILRVVEIEKTEDIKRPYIRQLIAKDLSFPLPHRIAKESNAKIFSAKRPSTFA